MESPLCPESFLSHTFLNGSHRVWRCSTTQVSPGEARLGPEVGEEPTPSPPGESMTSGPAVCRPMFSQEGDEPENRKARQACTIPGRGRPTLLSAFTQCCRAGVPTGMISRSLSHSASHNWVRYHWAPQGCLSRLSPCSSPDKVRTVNPRINRSWTRCSSPNQNSCMPISGKVRLVPVSSWSARASR